MITIDFNLDTHFFQIATIFSSLLEVRFVLYHRLSDCESMLDFRGCIINQDLFQSRESTRNVCAHCPLEPS